MNEATLPFGLFVLLSGIVLAGIIGLAWLGYRYTKKRREALMSLGYELGWRFEGTDYSFDEKYPQFEMFSHGDNRHARDLLSGALTINGQSCPAQAGDYQYQTTSGSGKNRRTTTHRFSFLVVCLPYRGVPSLLVRGENIFDKFAGALGFDDIDFESEEFSRAFHVKSADRKFAYDVCHPRMMEFLLATRPPPVEVEQGGCCISDASRTWTPEQFAVNIRWASEFFDRWPDYLKSDLARQGDAQG